MNNTPTPDKNEFSLPNAFEVNGPSGSFVTTEAGFQKMMAENKANGIALTGALDAHWKWLTESEPNKLSDKLALEDFMSQVVRYLVNDRKLEATDIANVVARQLEKYLK